jgi:uncharacterized protein YodC (DUF2158 family)
MVKFGIGDVVRLNSGGPNMTVTLYEEAKKIVYCKWVNESGQLQTEPFPDACIILVKPLTVEQHGVSRYDRVQLNG